MNKAPPKIYVSLHCEYDEPIDLETEMPTEFSTVPYEGPKWEYVRADLLPQWLPIESAPKDGRSILVCNQEMRDSCIVVGYDTDLVGKEPIYFHCWVGEEGVKYASGLFTHWMPVPKGPKE